MIEVREIKWNNADEFALELNFLTGTYKGTVETKENKDTWEKTSKVLIEYNDK